LDTSTKEPVRVSDFDFELPPDLVAQEAAPRGTSRMLVLDRRTGNLQHASIADLPHVLRAGDLLVVNNTRVFAARLLGRRVPTGGGVECLLLSPPHPEPDGTALCDALVHPGQKLKPGAVMRFEGPAGSLRAEVLDRRFFGRRRLRLASERGGSVDALIDALGHTPLPPYIRRPDAPADRERYQTVFATVRGSVAAPTAGLHFTPELLEALAARGVERATVTLHVGYGTFKPVRTEVVEHHSVDPERYEIDAVTAGRINDARREGRRVLAVGTTTTRALEDSAIRGGGRVVAGGAEAGTFIYPGFRFQVLDGLLTNFHVPRSTLLMLVCAFAGTESVLAAYREAVEHRYRFYSYGDAMLVV
jgi:S-adenosylmethionine:tRNA ribosyltransferase-isomerase